MSRDYGGMIFLDLIRGAGRQKTFQAIDVFSDDVEESNSIYRFVLCMAFPGCSLDGRGD